MKPGFIIAALATAYFVVIRFVIMPKFGNWFFDQLYKDLFPPGAHNLGGVLLTIVSNPLYTLGTMLTADKLKYALQIFLPLAFLPIRRGFLAVSMVPGTIFTLLTTGYGPTIDTGFQYSAHFVPYLFAAAAVCLRAYGAEGAGLVRRRAALATLIGGTAICGVFWGAIPPRHAVHGGFNMSPMRRPTAAERRKERDLRELAAMIPRSASVAISEPEMPHISRDVIRTLRDTTDADYLLYGTDSGAAGSSNGEAALARGEFEKVAERPGLKLLKRKTAPAPSAPPAPAAAARAPAAVPAPAPARAPDRAPARVPAPVPNSAPNSGPNSGPNPLRRSPPR